MVGVFRGGCCDRYTRILIKAHETSHLLLVAVSLLIRLSCTVVALFTAIFFASVTTPSWLPASLSSAMSILPLSFTTLFRLCGHVSLVLATSMTSSMTSSQRTKCAHNLLLVASHPSSDRHRHQFLYGGCEPCSC